MAIMQKSIKKELVKVRKYIPKKYNQLELMDYLADDKIDILTSITTRTDGKTFNYLMSLIWFCRHLGFCTTVVVRHADLRQAMLSQIQDVYNEAEWLDVKDFGWNSTADIITVEDRGYPCFLIVDLNSANDLKNFSGTLKQANIAIYDEFLALGGEYTNAEFLKFKTIFETMDRSNITEGMKYTNGRRKFILLGNPVDFGSEFLAYYNMYEMLEKQPMNTIRTYGNIALERRRNENAQENKNDRIFGNREHNESVTGLFAINGWRIKKPKDTTLPIVVKLDETYLYIYPEKTPILSVKPFSPVYKFNTEIADNRDESEFLDPEKFNRADFYKKYNRGLILFENQYSKQYILKQYNQLNIFKIIGKGEEPETLDKEVKKLKQVNEKTIKRRIMEQYLL